MANQSKNQFIIVSNGYVPVEYKSFKFSGGEVQVEVKSTNMPEQDFTVHAHIRDGDIMELAMVVNALRNRSMGCKIHLELPYLPYARQDRHMKDGDALGVKVFCEILNSLKLDSVAVTDCHSDVGLALIDNVNSVHQVISLARTRNLNVIHNKYDALVSPDAGASKKVYRVAKSADLPVIECGKVRNVNTGIIERVSVGGDVTDATLLIVDDICDGGATFINLAQELKRQGAKKVDLFVTHGIFSKGKQHLLDNGVDEVFTAYDWEKDRV